MSAPSEAGANCPEAHRAREWPKTNHQAITDYTYREVQPMLIRQGGNERCGAIEKEIISQNASEGITESKDCT